MIKWWMNYHESGATRSHFMAFAVIPLLIYGFGFSVNAQTDSLRHWRSSDPVLYKPPTVTHVHFEFETGNWHRVYIASDSICFQNALGSLTIAKDNLEKYLADHHPGDSVKLAIHRVC